MSAVSPQCSICLADISPEGQNWNHGGDGKNHPFHEPCIETWVVKKPDCPVCRQDLSADPKVVQWRNEHRAAPVVVAIHPAIHQAMQEMVEEVIEEEPPPAPNPIGWRERAWMVLFPIALVGTGASSELFLRSDNGDVQTTTGVLAIALAVTSLGLFKKILSLRPHLRNVAPVIGCIAFTIFGLGVGATGAILYIGEG